MEQLLEVVARWIAQHPTQVEAFLLAMGVSFIVSWPEEVPHCLRFIDPALWTWARDTVQGAVPLKFTKQTPRPTSPADPAQPKQQ